MWKNPFSHQDFSFKAEKKEEEIKILSSLFLKYFHVISMNWIDAWEEFICSVVQLGFSGAEKFSLGILDPKTVS